MMDIEINSIPVKKLKTILENVPNDYNIIIRVKHNCNKGIISWSKDIGINKMEVNHTCKEFRLIKEVNEDV